MSKISGILCFAFLSALSAAAFAQAGTPPAIVNKLNQEINRILQSADVKSRLDAQWLVFVPNTPQQFAAVLKAEVARYARMVKESGAKAD